MLTRVVVERKAVSQLLFSVRGVRGAEWTATVRWGTVSKV